jgi:hypothetical protein
MMNLYHYALLGSACCLLAGCPNDNDDDMMGAPAKAKFEVTVTNETAGQPFSPLTLIAHKATAKYWALGEPVSVGLEYVAETGNPSVFRDALKMDNTVYTTKEGKGLLFSGKTESFELELNQSDVNAGARLSLAAMLGKTNDGLVLMSGQKLSELKQGQSMTLHLLSYDAGTELNRETAETLGSAGFNPVRDDVTSALTVHGGVVSKDDGLANSALTQLEKWDNPVAKIEIKRL